MFSAAKQFSDRLSRAIPTALVPQALADFLALTANHRLSLAADQGVRLEEIFIDDDCLPSWEGLYWDPEQEALQDVVQRRSLERQNAQDLGDLLRREIRTKSERKLEEARRLGLSVEDLWVGRSLLPEWTLPEETSDDVETPSTATMDALSDAHQVEDSTDSEDLETTSLEDIDVAPTAEYPKYLQAMIAQAMMSDIKSCSDSSDSSTDDESEDSNMENPLSTGPIYDERGYSNVISSVELVGGSSQFADVDVEVLLAVDDDETYEALPEVELAVDGEAFIRHFGNKDMVEVDIPGMELFCLDAIEEDNDEDEYEPVESDDDDDTEEVEELEASRDDEDVGVPNSHSSCSEEE